MSRDSEHDDWLFAVIFLILFGAALVAVFFAQWRTTDADLREQRRDQNQVCASLRQQARIEKGSPVCTAPKTTTTTAYTI